MATTARYMVQKQNAVLLLLVLVPLSSITQRHLAREASCILFSPHTKMPCTIMIPCTNSNHVNNNYKLYQYNILLSVLSSLVLNKKNT